MAKCKNCHAEIPDGMEYCSKCEEENRIKADESYLDNLLNSVISDAPPTRTVKRKAVDIDSFAPDVKEKGTSGYNIFDDNNDDDFLDSVFGDSGDSNKQGDDLFDISPALDSTAGTSYTGSMPQEEPASTESSPLTELSESELEDALNLHPPVTEFSTEENPEDIQSDEGVDDFGIADILSEPAEDSDISDIQSDDSDDLNIPDLGDIASDESDDLNIPDIPDISSDIPEDLDIPEVAFSDEEQQTDAPTMPESDLGDLDILNMDYFNSLEDGESPGDTAGDETTGDETKSDEDQYKTEDELALADLLAGFQDTIDVDKVVESIETGDFDKELMQLIPEEEKVKSDNAVKKEKKKGFFVKVFGNVKEDLTEEQLEQRRQKELAAIEQQKLKEEEQKKKKSLSKEEKKKQKEAAAAEKKAAAAKAKLEKAAADKIKKEQAAEKARLKKEQKLAVLQIEEDPGRINKIGTTILLAFFTLLALFIIYGTDFYSYRVSINSASTNFDRQRYNEAYKDVYGLDIRDEDIELYDKIMTVMYVNKQLNSYNNYYAVGMTAEALDSLIKGLSRYEKYIQLASMLGIEQDMNIVRDRILTELENVFNVNEETAMSLININEQADYTMEVYALLGR